MELPKTVSFNELARFHDFDQIVKSDNPKYTTIQNYDVQVYRNESFLEPIRSVDVSDEEEVDITLCYALWQNPVYVKLLYLSFLSQILFSDALNLRKFKIYTDNKLEPLVLDVFNPFIENGEEHLDFKVEVESLKYEGLDYSSVANNVLQPNRFNKYTISLREDLRETDLLIISDCESFLYGERMNLYSQIHHSYQKHDDFPVLGCEEPNRNVFLNRRPDLAGMFYNDEEYIDWAVRRLEIDKEEFISEIVKRRNWFLTCWFIFDNSKYTPEDKVWEDYVNWSRAYSIHCDESIYLTYGITKKDYQIEDLSYLDYLKFITSEKCERFFKQGGNNDMGIVHPLHGTYAEDFWVQEFYDYLQSEFKSTLGNSLANNETLKEKLSQY